MFGSRPIIYTGHSALALTVLVRVSRVTEHRRTVDWPGAHLSIGALAFFAFIRHHSSVRHLPSRDFHHPPLIAPFMEGDSRFGSATRPRTTVDLKELKNCLANGSRGAFRKGPGVIWHRQGPQEHHRTNVYGAVLSAIALDGDTSDMARKIDRDKFIYLIKSGDSHQTYASFDTYKFDTPTTGACPVSAVSPTGSIVTALTTRGASALSYDGGIISMQSIWRVARHVRWLRHPIMVPIAIAVAIFAGVTPTVIADVVSSLGAPIAKFAWNWISHISLSWLGGPWLWLFPIIFTLVW